MSNNHKDILCSICTASTRVWKLQASFEKVFQQKEVTQSKTALFNSDEAMKKEPFPFCCHFEVCLLATLKGNILEKKKKDDCLPSTEHLNTR